MFGLKQTVLIVEPYFLKQIAVFPESYIIIKDFRRPFVQTIFSLQYALVKNLISAATINRLNRKLSVTLLYCSLHFNKSFIATS